MPLGLTRARKIVEGAQAKARELGVRVTVAVVDQAGLLVALDRMDGAAPLSAQIAEAKASGAATMLRDGGSLADVARDRPGFFAVADRLSRVPLVPGLGSVLIRDGEGVVGAVGVSGAKPEEDLACAEAGVAASA